MPTIVLNGEERVLPGDATVLDAVRAAGAPEDGRGVAVAVEGEVVARTEWGAAALTEGARVEVLQAVQGG